jgi:peptidylprolyl isomerase
MRFPFLICALCLALLAGASGCGGDDATSSQTQDTGSATTTEDSGTTTDDSATTTDSEGGDGGESDGEGNAKPDDVAAVLGDYEGEGPFSAVSGQGANKKPRFEPSGEPAPKEIVTRELEVGSGPAAKEGDKASVYFAGAIYETGKVELYGWPPAAASVVEIGSGLGGKEWEKTIVGMKVGGIRQVILPSSEFAQGKPVDYVIVMADLQPK